MDYMPPEISQQTHDAIKSYSADASAPTANYTQNNSAAQGLLSQPSQMDNNLSFGDQAQMDAIKSKYNQDFYREQNKSNLAAKQAAEGDKLRRMSNAANMANEEVQLNYQRELLKWQQKQAAKAQRSALIGNILGIGGAAVGFAYGGPVGGMAGMQAGRGVGGLAGGG